MQKNREKVGRPTKGNRVQVTIRIDEDLFLEARKSLADRLVSGVKQTSISDVINEALRLQFKHKGTA